jgi:hypothetical protein
MCSRKCGQVLTVCCPEGTNDGSQAIYCLERVQSRIRPVGHGMIPTPTWISRPSGGMSIGRNHTVPSGTVSVFAPKQGNKSPGYFHNVPT